jgi:glycosyltransferase involved in cell wall biosynthesis
VGNGPSTPLAATVVVPVRNGAAELPGLIDSLDAQTLPRDRFEIVIGDDGSADGGTEGLDSRDGWLRVTKGPPLTSYAARNRAANLARGRVLAFCDADCRPEPTWLEAGLRALERADVVAGEIRNLAPNRRTIWSLLDVEMSLDQRSAVRSGKAMTANLFVRRDLFEPLGGFDPSLPSGGDFDFVDRCVAKGARLAYSSEAVVLHPTPDDARSFLRKVWFRDRWASVRARPKVRDRTAGYLALVPVVGPLWARRRRGRPLGLDRQRLAAAGMRVGLGDDLRASVILYLFLPYFAALAQLRGALARPGDRNPR